MTSQYNFPKDGMIRFLPTPPLMFWVTAAPQVEQTLEEFVMDKGFASEREFHAMVANVNLTTPYAKAMFKTWQDYDGTKIGLEALPVRQCTLCGGDGHSPANCPWKK